VIERTLLGLMFAVTLSLLAYRVQTLSVSGAFTAAVIGTIVVAAGGWTPAVLLVLFFLSSSAFTRLSRFIRPEVQDSFAKGGRRDARQVLANGALPAAFSIMILLVPEENWLVGVVGSLAAATADTWATEWGVLARRLPRRITDWKQVPSGTSGGITALGTTGSLMGALVIGTAAGLMTGLTLLITIALLSGALGSVFDSVLGATVQVHYRCSSCGVQTEQHPTHEACGEETTYEGGLSWLDNDVVNLFANAFGALLAILGVLWRG
jgi:uncharacterized protein (TIGR00297 family)